MAIIYICKKCKGVGRVEKKIWFMTKYVSCSHCGGDGKKKYVKEKVI